MPNRNGTGPIKGKGRGLGPCKNRKNTKSTKRNK
jgi:hypothetical protein